VQSVRALQLHLVEEVRQVYRSQGVTIHDKHIQVIRQILRKVQIIEPGETEFLPGELLDRKRFEESNAEVVETGGEPASARTMLKASRRRRWQPTRGSRPPRSRRRRASSLRPRSAAGPIRCLG
jgi:hypothetical protein